MCSDIIKCVRKVTYEECYLCFGKAYVRMRHTSYFQNGDCLGLMVDTPKRCSSSMLMKGKEY